MASDLNIRGVGMTSQRTRARLVARLREQGIRSELILSIINEVPRHLFMDEALAHRAYEDRALTIGRGQTISQPFIVAKMTEALLSGGDIDKALEIGTGSGYQTAVLAQLVGKVYTVERIAELQKRAREQLDMIGCRNVFFKHGDGRLGWEEHAPFDAIIVTAAALVVPEALTRQLGEGGRMILPVGDGRKQELVQITRTGDDLKRTALGGVKFVPLLGGKS